METPITQTILTRSNTKIEKGIELGFLTFGIHFAPAKLSGYEVCFNRTKGCTLSCLNLSGHGIYQTTQKARIKKTRSFYENRSSFMNKLESEMNKAIKNSHKLGLKAVFRLNLTSDIDWREIKFEDGKNVFEKYPNVNFYDYTKVYSRLNHGIPNYHLTFSRAETKKNQLEAESALKEGYNVAMVFSTKKGDKLPETYNGYQVIDGDIHDLRFLDKKGIIVGLRAKGKAKTDKTGFVIKL